MLPFKRELQKFSFYFMSFYAVRCWINYSLISSEFNWPKTLHVRLQTFPLLLPREVNWSDFHKFSTSLHRQFFSFLFLSTNGCRRGEGRKVNEKWYSGDIRKILTFSLAHPRNIPSNEQSRSPCVILMMSFPKIFAASFKLIASSEYKFTRSGWRRNDFLPGQPLTRSRRRKHTKYSMSFLPETFRGEEFIKNVLG